MKQVLLLTTMLTFVFTLSAVPQDIKHAPTLQSCAADLNLWASQVGYPVSTEEQNRAGTKSLTIHQMHSKIVYLNDCAQAYPVFSKSTSGELPALFSLIMIYDTEIEERLYSFLDRHGLSEKFYQEDETGKR